MGAGNFVSDNCRIIPTRLTTTTLTTCYTAAGFPQVVGVRLVNFHATATPKINLLYYKATVVGSFYLQANYTMPVGNSLWLPYEGFAMYENDLLQAISDTANAVDVLVFIAEVPGRNQ
jgi:hypothetical protein